MATTWNTSDHSDRVTLSNGNKTATASHPVGEDTEAAYLIRSTLGAARNSGKWYFEVVIDARSSSYNTYVSIGVALTSVSLDYGVGNTINGWGLSNAYNNSNSIRHNNGSLGGFGSAPVGSVIGIAYDLDNGKLWFSIDDWWGGYDPVDPDHAQATGLSGSFVPALSWQGIYAELTGHFAESDLVYSIPAGFSTLDAELPRECDLASTLAGVTGSVSATAAPGATLSSELAGVSGEIVAAVNPRASISITLDGITSNIAANLDGPSATIAKTLEGVSSTITAYMPVLRYHQVYYASALAKLHSVSYSIGTIPQLFHQLSWCVEARRLHAISYEVTTLVAADRLHSISYDADQLTASVRLHEILYEGSGTSPLVADVRLHEISYSVVGSDPLSSAIRLHEVIYEGSGVSPLVADQRLHVVNYAVVGADPINSVSAFHQVSYAVSTNQLRLHDSFYQSVVEALRLHAAGWKADIEQRRLHETAYHTVDTSALIEAGTITVGDGGLNVYDFLSLSITSDEDSPYWQCEVALKDANDYLRFPRDTEFVIRLLSVDFHFIVDSRSLQRSIDDDGNYQEACTISGLSPLVRYASPRATRLTKTWTAPILASAAVEELIGTLTWDLVDWTIPAYRLAAENAAPLDVAKQIVEAVGGLIEAQPDGSVVCRHRWPVSIAALDTVVADHALDERTIFAASEEPTQDELIDRVRIFDSEAGFQDRMEYVPNKIGTEDDPRNGILYAFPSPWRNGLRIVTTRPSQIVVGSMTEGTRSVVTGSTDYPPELLTFSERTASTQYPIMSLTSLDWLDDDLGAASFTPYATTLEAGNGTYGGYSLAEVQYSTRYLSVPITCLEPVAEIEAQFLLLEETTNG